MLHNNNEKINSFLNFKYTVRNDSRVKLKLHLRVSSWPQKSTNLKREKKRTFGSGASLDYKTFTFLQK